MQCDQHRLPYATAWSDAGAVLGLVAHTLAETLAYIKSDRLTYAMLPVGMSVIHGVAIIATGLLLWLLEWGLWMRIRSSRSWFLIWSDVALVTLPWVPMAPALSFSNALVTMVHLPPMRMALRVGLSIFLSMVVTLGYVTFGGFI